MKRGYIMALANIARLNAHVAGMQAENQQRAHLGQSAAYPESAFTQQIDEDCCGWNDIIALLNQEGE